MDRLLESARLLYQRSYQVLGQYLRDAGDVEDVLLRIQRRQLSTGLRKRVDNLRRHLSHTSVEQCEEPGGPAADNGDVLDRCFLSHEITFAASGATYKLLADARRSLSRLESRARAARSILFVLADSLPFGSPLATRHSLP